MRIVKCDMERRILDIILLTISSIFYEREASKRKARYSLEANDLRFTQGRIIGYKMVHVRAMH